MQGPYDYPGLQRGPSSCWCHRLETRTGAVRTFINVLAGDFTWFLLFSTAHPNHSIFCLICNYYNSGGYGAQIIARPVLYDILRRGIPADKIHMKKKLVSYFDEDDSVTLDFADGTQYKGHVLIGADGAYSTVRRLMYAKIKEAGQLPEEDEGALPYRTTCLVGQTAPQSPEEFPEMRTEECTFYAVRGIIEPYTVQLLI